MRGCGITKNTTDAERAKFMADAQDKITVYTTPLVFFSLEINRIDDASLEAMFKGSDDLARYKPIFDRLRAMKPYQLSDELEKFLHDQSTVGAAAWNRLFDETIAGLEFVVGDEIMGIEATLNKLSDPDRDTREAGGARAVAVFGEHVKIFRPRPQHTGQGQGDHRSLARAAHAAKPGVTCPTM